LKASLWVFALLLIAAGLNHFWNPKFYLQIMPPYLPFHLELVYISGLFEVLGGVLLLFTKTQNTGVWVSIATLVLVYPANLHMALNAGAYPNIPTWILWLRLPLQALLIWWAYSLRLR
jgi:uncharacterized membrane protein